MRRWMVVLVLGGLAAAGCGGGEGVSIEGVWARPSPAMADAGAVYMQITSDVPDRLVGAAVDPSVAEVVEIHETVIAGGEAEDGMGAMTMREVGVVDLPAGETVGLEPGGYHVMLMGLAAPLEAGETFEITLDLEVAGSRTLEVEVRETAP